ncbi:MAG TPA: J domain-containing protein [Spirochaetota bacterium]|nr:J domain-containing protein [Spirochaetota bacterium]HPN82193.1 J domain-containing protein [Spirochaetota bacterium]
MATWEEISEARGVLGVGEDATLAEIRRIFRDRIKAAHPDAGGTRGESARVTAAWKILREYCEGYRFRFTEDEVRRNESPEERMKRMFRQDTQWGPGQKH